MPRTVVTLFTDLLRYSIALAGPFGSAGAQFVLSLVLLRLLDPAEFGRFSFLLITAQLSWGIWSALLCAPLPLLLAQRNASARESLTRAFYAANIIGALAASAIFLAIGLLLAQTLVDSTLFAGFAAVALLRWFARAHAYATGRPLRTTLSDLVYSVALLGGVGVIATATAATPTLAFSALLASAVAGMIPFGRTYLKRQFLQLSLRTLGEYRAVWRDHSRWALVGVMTTEVTANAHVYIVTLLLGPAAFAPIAASALMIRPITVVMNALTEFERAQMSRMIGAGQIDRALAAVRFFRIILVLVWVATAAAIIVLLALAPRLIFPSEYPLWFLATGAALWMGTSFMRLLRTPESALLQAAGAFRPLAVASIWSSGISVAAVLALIVLSGPLWSIVGILIGEALFAVVIWRQAARWIADGARTLPVPVPEGEPGGELFGHAPPLSPFGSGGTRQ